MTIVSVIIPTIAGREADFERCIGAYLDRSANNVQIIVERDHASCGLAWQAGLKHVAGDYIHLTCDDIEPLEGWDAPAVEACAMRFLPAPQVCDPAGNPQSAPQTGVIGVDWAEVTMTALPFASVTQMEKIVPLFTAHYYCVAPETPILTAQMMWVPAGKLSLGDELVGVDEFPEPYQDRKYRQAVVTGNLRRRMQCVLVRLKDGREVVCTFDHPWLVKTQRRPFISNGKQTTLSWIESARLQPGDLISSPVRVWEMETSFDAGWLSGIFDGEGSIGRYTSGLDRYPTTSLSVAQNPGFVLDRMKSVLDAMDVRYVESPNASNSQVSKLRVCSIADVMEVLGRLRPVRLKSEGLWEGASIRTKSSVQYVTVAEVIPVGVQEVVALGTSTGTFLANGMVSHNTDDFFGWRGVRAGWPLRLRSGYRFIHHWAQHRRGAGMNERERMSHDEQLYLRAQAMVEAGTWLEPWPREGI